LDIYLKVKIVKNSIRRHCSGRFIWNKLHITCLFAYLKKHENGGRIEFDSYDAEIDVMACNVNADWTDFFL
jgi:hypothetical protein